MFSLDRWPEVLVTIGRNKLRTALTMISVAWGIFVLVFLLGLGRGLDQGARHKFAREATNGVWMMREQDGVAYGGYDVGRHITFDNRDYERAKNVKGVEHISASTSYGGAFGGTALMTKRGGKANSFQINAVHADAFYLDEARDRRRPLPHQGRHRAEAQVGGRSASRSSSSCSKADEDPIGEWIEVAGVPFQVVGVFTRRGRRRARAPDLHPGARPRSSRSTAPTSSA